MSAPATAPSVWSSLVGQQHAVATLQRAVSGHGMTHAWLFTGPPGSGRSNAAIAFAAALQCERGGCGECHACQTVLAGSHPDVSVTRSETAVLYIDDMRVADNLVEELVAAPWEAIDSEAIAGLRAVASGTIRLGERDVTTASVRDRAAAGLAPAMSRDELLAAISRTA